MLCIKEHAPLKPLSADPLAKQSLFVRIKPKKKRWFSRCSYNPSKKNIKMPLETVSRNLALHSSSYVNVIVLGAFNVGVEEATMSIFGITYDIENLSEGQTYLTNPKIIYLEVIKYPHSFINS